MKNKKLIIICPSMWPDMNLWGETQRMYYLANYLAEWGWQITVISPSVVLLSLQAVRKRQAAKAA